MDIFLIYMSLIFGVMFLIMVFNCTIKKSILDKLMIVFCIHSLIFCIWLIDLVFFKIQILNLF